MRARDIMRSIKETVNRNRLGMKNSGVTHRGFVRHGHSVLQL